MNDDGLGRVAILHRVGEVGNESLRAQRSDEVATIAADTFRAVPGTTVVGPTALSIQGSDGLGAAWMQCSDCELITAARQADIDTHCLVDVRQYGGWLSVGLNPLPGWWVDSRVNYRVRVLDVETGRLVAGTCRSRAASRSFALSKPQPLADVFADDLRALLNKDGG